MSAEVLEKTVYQPTRGIVAPGSKKHWDLWYQEYRNDFANLYRNHKATDGFWQGLIRTGLDPESVRGALRGVLWKIWEEEVPANLKVDWESWYRRQIVNFVNFYHEAEARRIKLWKGENMNSGSVNSALRAMLFWVFKGELFPPPRVQEL